MEQKTLTIADVARITRTSKSAATKARTQLERMTTMKKARDGMALAAAGKLALEADVRLPLDVVVAHLRKIYFTIHAAWKAEYDARRTVVAAA